MADRHRAPCVAVIVATFALVIPVRAVTQDGSNWRNDWTTHRTPWGDPDLQGVWTTDSEQSVPLERPAEFGNRTELTAEQLAKRVQREKQALANASPLIPWEYDQHVSRRTSLIIDPPDGRIPAVTPGAKARAVDPRTLLGFVGGSFTAGPFNGPEDLNLADRCITRGLPQTWQPSAYNNGFQIVQSPGFVAILYERLHESRVIPLDGRSAPNIGQIFGISRGHWDGDTLVVEVTNFSDQTTYTGRGFPTTGTTARTADSNNYGSGSTRRLVERYTRVDADTVRVEVTIDDPTTWAMPWTFAVNGRRDPDYWQIFEYACHEGNYGMTNILSGARAEERAAAGGGRK
jgi:hypothetical protein